MLLFSIIIPAFNIETWLPLCLNSLKAQSYSYWEAIVVDDGSTDKTGEIGEAFQRLDKRFKVVHQPNSGVATARNLALSLATGDWIGFLDGDDVLHPECLLSCQKAIDKHPSNELTLFGHVYSENPVFQDINVSMAERCLDTRNTITLDAWNTPLWGAFYKRSFIDKLLFSPYSYAEDTLFYRKALLKSSSITFLPYQLYGYRARTGSAVCSKMTFKKIVDAFRSYLELYDAIKQSGKTIPSKAYQDLWRRLFEWPILRLDNGKESKAFLQEWISSNKALAADGNVPLWYAWRFSIVKHLPYFWTAKLFMAFPLFTTIWLVRFRNAIRSSR